MLRRPPAALPLALALAICIGLTACAGATPQPSTDSSVAMAPAPAHAALADPALTTPGSHATATTLAPGVELAAEARDSAPDRFVEILLRAGESPPGADGLPVTSIGIVTTDGAGRPAFAGTLGSGSGTETFVWQGSGIVWRSSDVQDPRPSNPSPLIGIGDTGQFVFQTAVDEVDAVWARPGLLLKAGEPAPGFDRGATIRLSRWTTMTPEGVAYWLSEFRDGPGTRGKGRVLYRSLDATPATTEVVLRADQEIEGVPIARPFGLEFSYQVSDDNEHLVQILQRATGSTSDDEAVYVDGGLPLIEGQPTTDGDHWNRFSRVAINNRGDYLVTAETDAPNTKDAVLAFNGVVALRESMIVDGQDLSAQASILAVTLDNLGRAAHLWSVGGFGAEYLFFACDAANLQDSVLLTRSNERLRLADPTQLMTIHRFNGVGHGPALSLSTGDRLYVEVLLADKLRPPDETFGEAVLSLPLPSCPTPTEPDPVSPPAPESS